MMRFQILTICVVLFLTCVNCAKILVIFQAPSQSHTILGKKLVDGLLQRGHHVTMATPFNQTPRENFTLIELKSILDWKKAREEKILKSSMLEMLKSFILMTEKGSELTYAHPAIQKIIREKTKFDLVLMPQFFNDAFYGLAHHVGAPVILFGLAGSNSLTNTLMANPNPLYIRKSIFGFSSPDFIGRLSRLVGHIGFTMFSTFVMEPLQESIMKKYIPTAPSIEELKTEVALVLLNAHVSIESPRPNLPNVINIGGFHLSDPKPLPEDIKKFLDGAKEGAILFSFGSNVLISTIDKEKVNAIMKVLGEQDPIRVLFKSEIKHENLPKNIMVSNWLPQADILAHKNIKVFISHMGLGGVTESVYNGVPMLGIPFFADQFMNAEEAEEKGYGLQLKMTELTEDSFRKKLRELIDNPKYLNEIKRRSALMKKQPVKPLDNAMFWIEHIIEYGGGSHLRNDGVFMPWYQLYLVDMYIFFTVLFLLLLITFYQISKYSIRLVKKIFCKKTSCCDGKKKVKQS